MNKGVGRSVEFRGLTSQYLFLFAAGMLASLLLTMVLYMAGADRTLCILVALVCMSLVIWGTFRMNRPYIFNIQVIIKTILSFLQKPLSGLVWI